jgi:hypothetical protein
MQNHLLAALPTPEFDRLSLHLEPFRCRWARRSTNRALTATRLFPDHIDRVAVTLEDGASAEIAVAGMKESSAFRCSWAARPPPAARWFRARAITAPAQLLKQEFNRAGPVPPAAALLQALITQMTQTAVCNRHHTVEQQLCRWLLLSLDRLSSDSLTMTQELIANMLGVRREGVTEAAGKLQRAGLIRYTRGRIEVIDRPALERAVCECYAVVKREFDRLITDIPHGDPLHVLGQSVP